MWNITEPGDGVVVFSPIYFPFLGAIDDSGRRRIECPLTAPGWRIAPERPTDAVGRFILHYFAAWLAPRLAPFQDTTPGIQYILAPDEGSDFTEANLDLAIRFIAGPGELEGVQLAPALQVAVAAPGARDAWIDWPEAGLPQDANPSVKTTSAGQAMSSALAGMGRTVLPLALVARALANGLLEALGEPEESKRAYWLVAPLPQWRSKKVKALVAYLTAAE